jgi:hypothetical protein
VLQIALSVDTKSSKNVEAEGANMADADTDWRHGGHEP